MASKFMRIKKVVIPLITLVILVSQISGCAIMNRDDAVGILADNDEVVVEYAEPDEDAGVDGVAGQIDTSVPEDTSEDLEDTEDMGEIGVVDNIGTLDEETGPEGAEQVGEVGEPEAPEVEAPVEAEPTYSFTSVNETVYATDMNASGTMIPPASAFRMNKAIQHLSVRSSRLDKASWN